MIAPFDWLDVLGIVLLVFALLPLALGLLNLFFYRAPRPPRPSERPQVSILVPARDEERMIGRVVEAALASEGVELEVVVMDDGSSDRTPEIVRGLAARDPRVRLENAPPLPAGWCGKPHACHAAAAAARMPHLLFIDADVLLEPLGAARAVAHLERSGAAIASGIPRQITGTWAEKLIVPLIHVVLLGYLPFIGVRMTRKVMFAAGCGQFVVARKEAYDEVGGHGAIRDSFHDGMHLPRVFRERGHFTDLFDATPLSACRMYERAGDVFRGFAKNAHEGMGGPVAIWVWTVLLSLGHVLPPLVVLALALAAPESRAFDAALAATIAVYALRLLFAFVYRQSLLGALLHPVGVALLVGIQWYARFRRRAGRAVAWKGRVQHES